MKRITINKIKGKLVWWRIKFFRHTRLYPFLYLSYWHFLVHKLVHKSFSLKENHTCYYSAKPNPGAGIGHQMANWIAGYWFAHLFKLKFAHLPFPTPKWEEFLGLGIGEKSVNMLKKEGYTIRKLPLFNENNPIELELNKKIIQSYEGKKIVFIAEQDQFYQKQYEVINELKKKFYNAPARNHDHLIYKSENYNIAIHVRRGDIMSDPNNPGLLMRYLSNDYFEKVLEQVIKNINVDKPIQIYFFSQGEPSNYPEFFKFKNLHWCLDMNAQESFLHMVFADLLITSKSSFSYKPALLNNGIKICPRIFWHSYPSSKEWILCENNGTFNTDQLKKLL